MGRTPLLTNSSTQTFKECPRRYFFRYEAGIKPAEESEAKHVGTLFHRAKQMEDLGYADEEIAAELAQRAYNEYQSEMVARMWVGHRWRWQEQEWESLATERSFDLPIRNPETNGVTQAFRSAGVLDRLVKLPSGILAYHEYKTTGDPISDLDSAWWQKVAIDQQPTKYLLALRTMGFDVRTIIYDVTHRPGLKPLLATPPEKRKYRASDGKLHAKQRLNDETPQEYGDRIGADIESRPHYYFQRKEIVRTEDDLKEYEAELWMMQRSIAECRKNDRFYTNTNSCLNPGRCEFLRCCSHAWVQKLKESNGALVPEGFVHSDDVHPELELPEAKPAT